MASRHLRDEHDDFKRALISLRDSPVEHPDPKFMVKLFEWVMELPSSPDNLHWFCDRAGEVLVMASTFLLRLFAYDSSRKLQWLERLELVLTGCCNCIRGLQLAKQNARQTYLSIFETENLNEFMDVVDGWERDLVLRTLSRAGVSPHTLPTSSARPMAFQDVSPATSYHIFFNIRILKSDSMLSIVQSCLPRSPIEGWPSDPPPPGLFYLLLHPDAALRTFATSNLSRSKCCPIHEELFSEIYLPVLETFNQFTLSQSHIKVDFPYTDEESVIWESLLKILPYIPNGRLRSSRSISVDLGHSIAGRLHDGGQHFAGVLKCFSYVLKRLDTTFWADRGEDYPLVVFASIKDNASFFDLLQPVDSSDDIPWFLSWILDFARSSWPLHTFEDLLAKMFDFLCEELQHERFKASRPTAMWTASKLLVEVLRKTEGLHSAEMQTQRRAALQTLHIHVDRLVAVALSREYTVLEWALARRVSRELIYKAMRLEIKDVLRATDELYRAFKASKEQKKGSTLSVHISPPTTHHALWSKVYDALHPGDSDAMAMIIHLLSRIAHLDNLMQSAFTPVFDRVAPNVLARQTFDEINRSLNLFRSGFPKAASRFSNYNSMSAVQQLLSRESIVEGLWCLMFSPVEDVRAAGQTIIGQAFDVDIRSESFQSLIRHSPERSFNGTFTILETFISHVPTSPESCMLSASLVTCLTDLIDVLAGPLDALLFDQSFVAGRNDFKPAARIPTFWKLMARAAAVIFQHTPAWSVFVEDTDWMVNWMRDALILCRQMLDCWRKFEEAFVTYRRGPGHFTGDVTREGKRMVRELQVLLPELARWLRLTNEELLHQSFALLRSLFACFEAAQIPPDPAALSKLKQDVERARSKASSTKLDSKRLKDLHDLVLSFEQVDDEVEIVSGPPLKQNKQEPLSSILAKPTEGKSGGGLKPSRNSQRSIKDFTRPGQPSGKATLNGGNTLDFFFGPGDGKLDPSSKKPGESSKSVHSQHARTKWKPLPAPSRDMMVKSGLSARAQPFSVRDQEKLDAAAPPRPKPIQPSIVDAQVPSSKSEPEDASSSSYSSGSDGGGMESLRALQKKKQPERRTKMMDIVPGASAGHIRFTARDEARRARERMKPDVSDLHRAILSWAYEHEGDVPPGKPLSPRPASERYPNYWEFRTTFEPLLLLECWAQLVNEKREKKDAYDLEITSRQYSDQWMDLDAFIEEHFATGWFLTEADVVLLRNPRTGQTILAKVQSFRAVRGQRQGAQITLRCHLAGRPDPGLSPNTTWSIMKAFSLATVHREYAALVALEFYDYCDFILNPRLSPPPRIEQEQVEKTMKKHRVNEPQARAIVASLQSRGFSLIQGPPGTGKTSTICALVQSFLESRSATSTVVAAGRSAAAEKTAPKKVLICAPSNAAIDEVASRVRHRADGQPIKVVRLGADKALNLSTKDISLDAIVDERLNSSTSATKSHNEDLSRLVESLASVRKALQEKENEVSELTDNTARAKALEVEREALQTRRHELSRQVNNLRDKQKSENRTLDSTRRNIRMQVLFEADVICSTLSGAGHDMLEHLDFEMIIIDEAAQAIELSTLIPLKFSCARCIMVGDPQQLPPTVISKEATKYNYNQSLFVRLQKQRPDAVHLLSIQYRMHPDISAFPSLHFYQGRLQDGPGMAERTKRPWQENPRFGTYRFFNVVNGQERSVGTSTTNPTEVSIATHLYNRLAKEYSSVEFASRIGVIAPYREQVRALRQAFQNKCVDPDGVDFNTVDGFQGQEKDIIILSCVRAGPGLESIGFLSDERRMNVALTRAKSSLFILGHAATLERSNRTWAQLIQNARERSALIDIDSTFFTSYGPLTKLRMNTQRLPAPPPASGEPLLASRQQPTSSLPPNTPALLTPAEIRAKATHGLANSSQSVVGPVSTIADLPPATSSTSDVTGESEMPRKRPAQGDASASGSSKKPKPLPGPQTKKAKQTTMFLPKKKPPGR